MSTNRDTLAHWLLQRLTAILLLPTILLANVSTLIALTILVFWHIHIGIEEILTDYIHHDVTLTMINTLIRVLIIIALKYAFLCFVL